MRASNGPFTSEADRGARERLVRLFACVPLALALGLVGSPASASEPVVGSPPQQSAADLKVRADAAMDGGAYAEAISAYRASYELSRNPALLYNIGSAYERLGDYPRALAYLEQFSRVASLALKARVPSLPEVIAAVRAKLARVVVASNVAGARVLVRGTWKGTTPLATSIAALPGPARVEVVADGYLPFARDVLLGAGQETRLDAVLLNSRALAWESSRAPSAGGNDVITSKWWFWTGVGVVVAGGVTAAVLALTHRSTSEPSFHTSSPLISW